MSEDFEKAQRLHDLTSIFDVSPDFYKKLVSQINDPKVRENLERIELGLKVEDSYYYLFSAMPWVKNIHSLHQQQEKDAKEKYQVPDYSLLVENSQYKNFPVLVEVKSVKKEKMECEIMGKQAKGLQQYSADNNNIPLLIAIYWERIGLWTHNTLKNFEYRRNYKIKFFNALANDLSRILGDTSYFINKEFFRKTIFENNGIPHLIHYPQYGEIKKEFYSKDGIDYKEFTGFERSIIDSVITMKQISVKQNNNVYEQIEISESKTNLFKLSYWVLRALDITPFDQSYRVGDTLLSKHILWSISELMKYLEMQEMNPMPIEPNKWTDYFFNIAYKNTNILDRYNNSPLKK